MTAIGFVLVAAVATLARVVLAARQPVAGRFPWPTLAVNIVGAAALGAITAAQWWHDPVVATGAGLGSFTTFSTVAGEIESLVRDDHGGRAVAYLAATLVLGVAAAWIGLRLG